MNNNKNDFLCNAKADIHDEFYTLYDDIEEEVSHYFYHFKDKIVYCNCDDPYKSNFVKYFLDHFNEIGLKEFIATCYDGTPFGHYQLSLFEEDDELELKTPYKLVVKEVGEKTDINSVLEKECNSLTTLKEHGDFRSKECIEILKGVDIVVTNPPFSLWRKYVSQLLKYNKQFLILGNINDITYKEFFPYIAQNKVWLGYSHRAGDMKFLVPDEYENRSDYYNQDENGQYLKVSGVRWFTNLTFENNISLELIKDYNEVDYPKYENIDAINVEETQNIPKDYYGVMGVPITFLDKYDSNQFELLGVYRGEQLQYYIDRPKWDTFEKLKYSYEVVYPILNGEKIYRRLLIRRK